MVAEDLRHAVAQRLRVHGVEQLSGACGVVGIGR
jgi:hypothetical protein